MHYASCQSGTKYDQNMTKIWPKYDQNMSKIWPKVAIFPESPLWLLMHMAPIKNDKDLVVLFLCQFKDITALKQPLDDENTKV